MATQSSPPVLKAVHAADIHLGRRLPGARAEEIQMTFEDLISYTLRAQADLLLLAGDVFDRPVPERESVDFLRACLEKLPPSVTVAIAPGNHDYLCAGSPYLLEDWPENVRIFTDDTPIELAHSPLTLWGSAFTGSYQETPLLEGVRPPDDARIHIGVLHGEVVGDQSDSRYNPVRPRDIAKSGLHYLALGHIHQRSEPKKAGRTEYAYSGCPEGFGFGEPGALGAYELTVSPLRTEIKFVPLCRRMYLRREIDVSGLTQPAQVAERILSLLEGELGEAFAKHFYELSLNGPWSGVPDLAVRVQTRLSETLHFAAVENETAPDADQVLLAGEDSLKGIFVRLMLQAQKSAPKSEQELYRQALRMGLAAFEGEVSL